MGIVKARLQGNRKGKVAKAPVAATVQTLRVDSKFESAPDYYSVALRPVGGYATEEVKWRIKDAEQFNALRVGQFVDVTFAPWIAATADLAQDAAEVRLHD